MFNVAVVNCNLKNYAGAQNYHFVLIIVCYLRLFFCLLLNSLNELVWSYCFVFINCWSIMVNLISKMMMMMIFGYAWLLDDPKILKRKEKKKSKFTWQYTNSLCRFDQDEYKASEREKERERPSTFYITPSSSSS